MLLSGLDIICLASIVIFGVPHGAFDYAFMKDAVKGRNVPLSIVITAYVLLVLLSLILWFLAPTFSIIIFLSISTYHFGAADPLSFGVESKNLKSLAIFSIIMQGGLTTTFLPLLHWTTFSQYLTDLQSNSEILFSWLALSSLLWAISALVVFKNLFYTNQKGKLAVILLICLLVWIVKPLFFFALFFCCSHAWSHYKKSMRHLSSGVLLPSASFFTTTILAWVLIIIVSFGFFPISGDELEFMLSPNLLRGVFASLFALTVPHILVVDFMVPSRGRSEVLDIEQDGFTS
jgi:Brp/Blh family beta-carotene 15,15'-monooxygenase